MGVVVEPSWEADLGAFSAFALLAVVWACQVPRVGKLSEKCFQSRPSPSLADASKLSCFAPPVPGSLFRAFVHTPQWGHPWKRLTGTVGAQLDDP